MPRLSALTLAVALAVGSLTAQAAPLPQERTLGHLEQVFAFQDAMPTGVTVSETGRIFVNYPRWGDVVPFTVAELKDGKAVPYPSIFDPSLRTMASIRGYPVNSIPSTIVVDRQGRVAQVWLRQVTETELVAAVSAIASEPT